MYLTIFYVAGADSVAFFQKGIQLMLSEKEERERSEVTAACGAPQEVNGARGGSPGDSKGPTDRMVSEAYLSIAEIYMTDCW